MNQHQHHRLISKVLRDEATENEKTEPESQSTLMAHPVSRVWSCLCMKHCKSHSSPVTLMAAVTSIC